MKNLLLPALIGCLLLGGCHKDIQNEAAVRQGILNYLSKRPDLSSMDVTVTKVAFRQNEADATVHFQAKNSSGPGTGLDLNYVLERQGNDWVVKGKSSSGHGAGMTGATGNPHGMGVPGEGQAPAALPPGHPPLPAAGAPPSTPPPGQK